MKTLNKENKIKFVIVFNIFLFLIISFFNSIQLKQHHAIAEATDRFTYGISSAISTLIYGKKIELTSLVKVATAYQENAIKRFAPGAERERALRSGDIQNFAIKEAIKVKNAEEYGVQKLDREDKGQVYFFITAFKLFGFNVQSFVYLYYLLLFISLLCFILEFLDKPNFLLIPLSFVFIHGAMMNTIWEVGTQLLTPVNPRFLPVLGIIPILHLTILVTYSTFNYRRLLYTFFQTALLILILVSRSSSNYFLIFFFGIILSLLIFNNYKFLSIRKLNFSVINFKSLIVIIFILFSVSMFYKKKLSIHYGTAQKSHYFWHPFLLGLYYHPTSLALFGHHCCSDNTNFEDFQKYQESAAQSGNTIAFTDENFETFLKHQSLSLIKNNPLYTLRNYAYKFYKIYTLPIDSGYPLLSALFNWRSLLFITLWGWLVFQVPFTKVSFFVLLLFLPALSSLPLMLLAPEYYAASDFVVCYLIFFSFIPFYIKLLFRNFNNGRKDFAQ